MIASLLEDVHAGIEVSFAPLTTDQYHQMIEAGILEDGEPIELIEGVLVYKDRRDEKGGIMTHGSLHLRVLNKLMVLLSQWVSGKAAFLQVQGPILLCETNEPEPDCCLVRGTPDDYADEVPHAADVLAVFEVAFSSLRSDRRTKQRLYATAGIPLYVIVNLKDGCVEIHEQPDAPQQQYLQRTVCGADETLEIIVGDMGPLQIPVRNVM